MGHNNLALKILSKLRINWNKNIKVLNFNKDNKTLNALVKLQGQRVQTSKPGFEISFKIIPRFLLIIRNYWK